VVVDLVDNQGNKYLCAYLVSNLEISATELKVALSSSLPSYMVPAFFMQIEKIPLNSNGKVDRKALPEPAEVVNLELEYVAPRDEIEEELARVWSYVLGVEKVGIDDDFFTLGGQSIKVIQALAMVNKKLKIEVPIAEMFSNPTIREVGGYIKKVKENQEERSLFSRLVRK